MLPPDSQITLNVDEAAAVVGVSRSTIIRAYTDGRLKVCYLGKGKTKPRIDRDDLIAWVKTSPGREHRGDAA